MIPFARPILPAAKSIVPYLEEIDRNHWYSNFGPLEQQFKKGCADLFQVQETCVSTFANGTLALQAALQALELPLGSLCLVPAWTFSATPAAVLGAGLVPYFVDVSPQSQTLCPKTCATILKKVPAKSIIVVAPFGKPVDLTEWEILRQETGISIIIDAAAGFASFTPHAIPAMISLHATKIFGVGEGGLLVSTNEDLIHRTKQMSNFGFNANRISETIGTNAKLSEYHAAVGLANLDMWLQTQKEYYKIAYLYNQRLQGDSRLCPQENFGKTWVSGTLTCELMDGTSEEAISFLKDHGIDARKTWQNGCHTHPAYAPYVRGDFPVTDLLAQKTFSLPFHLALSEKEIDYIADVLKDFLNRQQSCRQKRFS